MILQTDGSLLAGFRYRGPDLDGATDQELTSLAWHVNDALLPFADDWMFHFDAIRRPARAYPPSTFPDPITQAIDDERRAVYERQASRQFESEYFLVATYLPPVEVFTKLTRLFVRGTDSGMETPWHDVLARFTVAFQRLEARLAGRLQVERLDADALLIHLHGCVAGLAHPVRTPPQGAYLNQMLANQEVVGGFEPRVGAQHVRVVAVQGWPAEPGTGHLAVLDSLPLAYRWSTRVIPLGQGTAAKLIRRHQLQWFKRRKGAAAWAQEMFSAKRAQTPSADDELFLDHDDSAMAQDAGDAATSNASGRVRYCCTTQEVLVFEPEASRADQAARDILKALNDAGCPARIETVNAFEAYLGSLPGHGLPNLRRPLLSTRNVADLIPVTSIWPGLSTNPSPLFPPGSPPLLWAATAGATPFRLNLHDSDVGYTLVLGKTGSGKSVLLGMLAAQFRRYPEAQVFAFDVGYSLWPLAKAIGVYEECPTHYDLAAGRADALRLQPLARIEQTVERAWAAEWIETVLALQGVTATPPLRARIDRALELVAGNGTQHRTLTELSVQLQHEAMAAALRPYTVGGHYGELLDAGADDLHQGRFEIYELKHLFALDDKIAVPVLLYLLRRVEQRLDGRPTLILIDEAWMALAHSLFGRRINQWLLQLRKANTAVVLATQSPAQLAQLPNRHTIVDSCSTRIYLPNPDVATPGQAPLYRDLGLNDRELTTIGAATPKRHYYVTSPRGRRLIELGLGDVALSFLATPAGSTADDTRRHLTMLSIAHGVDWPATWLDERGLSDWATRLRAFIELYQNEV
jgi:type IV secretion/conjugal transfer VirB4 family ATPase